MTQTLYAHLDDANRVTEPPVLLSDEPAKFYGPEVGARFRPCPPETRQGSVYDPDAKAWTHPADPEPSEPIDPDIAEPQPTYRTEVSRTEYYGLFEPVEEAMIRLAAARVVTIEMVEAADAAERQKLMATAVLKVMLARVDNLSTTQRIQLSDHQVGQGLDLCAQMGFLADGRSERIRRGVLEIA